MFDPTPAFDAAAAKALAHLELEYSRLQAGRASSSLVESILVELYGSMQQVQHLASVSVQPPSTIVISPWDKSALNPIDKAISLSDLKLPVTNNGNSLMINIPPLTEERRKELVKFAKKLADEAHVALRNARHDALGAVKKEKDNKAAPLSENDAERLTAAIEKRMDAAKKRIDELAAEKEKQIMAV